MSPTPSDDQSLSWAALLGHWTEFAQASLALPTEGEGGRWRAAVPHVIALQAVTHALGELSRVDPQDRPSALDRATLSNREHATGLHKIWEGVPLPESVAELIADARTALDAAASLGVQWVLEGDESCIFAHPGTMAQELVAHVEPDLELFLPASGVPMRPGAVVGTIRRTGAGPVDEELMDVVESWLASQADELRRVDDRPVAQVYRQFDFGAGGPVRDVIVPASGEPLAGQPLLVPVLTGGRVCPVSLPPRGLVEVGDLPVEDRLGV